MEILVEDHKAGPAAIASSRIDIADWMESLPSRDREIAESLAVGNRTGDVARRFRISPGRISQLRRELAESWREFVGDGPNAASA